MVTASPDTLDPGAHTLTPVEFDAMLERRTQRSLGMSLDEFLRAHDAGALPDIPVVHHLLLLINARAGTNTP